MSVETRSRPCPNCGSKLPNPEANNGHVIEHPYFEVNLAEKKVYVNRKNIDLTQTEYLIFENLVKTEGVVTHEQFGRQHWQDYEKIVHDTKVHISHIRKKIKEAGGQNPIVTRHGVGYELKSKEIVEREMRRAENGNNGHQIRGY